MKSRLMFLCALCLVMSACVGGVPIAGLGGGGTGGQSSGTCGSGTDDLAFSNLHASDLSVTIGYPNGTMCTQQLDSAFSTVTFTNTSFNVGETYSFLLSATNPNLIIPPSLTCTVDEPAVSNGIATVEVLLSQPNFDNMLRIRCAGNWVEG